MNVDKTITQELIINSLLKSSSNYLKLFVEFQSNLLSNIYKRYSSVENGYLVLFFAKEVHQSILRNKDYDINFDVSFESFWKNHEKINPNKNSIIDISKITFMPKETVRRKIMHLVNKKVLDKRNKRLGFFPNEKYKFDYNEFINKEIIELSNVISLVSSKIENYISPAEVQNAIKHNFSFFWFHYLDSQLKFISLWKKKVSDLELMLISYQCLAATISKLSKDNLSLDEINKKYNSKNFLNNSTISATSISDITGIPRATCLRKLDNLAKLKIVKKDETTKRFFLTKESINAEGLASWEFMKKSMEIFGNFYLICLRTIYSK